MPKQTDQIKVDAALEELNRLQPAEQLAALEVIQKRRLQKNYVRYFKPWEPDQAQAIKKFTEDIKIFGLLGGNRSGKTILGAFICVAWCLGKRYFAGEPAWDFVKDLPIPEGPVNVWVVGVDFPTLRDVIWHEKLRFGKSHPAFLPDDPSVISNIRDGDFQIFFKNGTILTGKSAEAGREKFQGASVDLIWIDEECEKEVYDECYQRTIDCSGKILLTQTPLTDINSAVKDPWVFDLYEEWLEGKPGVEFCQLSTINSPFISEKDKKDILQKWEGSQKKELGYTASSLDDLDLCILCGVLLAILLSHLIFLSIGLALSLLILLPLESLLGFGSRLILKAIMWHSGNTTNANVL